jgi:hypothetical protein
LVKRNPTMYRDIYSDDLEYGNFGGLKDKRVLWSAKKVPLTSSKSTVMQGIVEFSIAMTFSSFKLTENCRNTTI